MMHKKQPQRSGAGAHPKQSSNWSHKSRLCQGMFCQLLARFEVPSEEAQLTEQFNLWFYKHEIGDSITVGTQAEIRTRIHCLFCRFVQSVIVARESAGCDDSALCVAKLAGGGGFRLDMSFPSERSVMPLGERFLFVGASAQAGAECGRLVDPNGLDYGMIRNWLAICERLHQDVCPIPDRWKTRQMRAPSRLRVMDVLENCLVDIPWQWKYVALSYVWGSAQPPKLIKAELPSLMRPGALANIRSNAPRTIQDVMDFTSRMGIQYLWFDSLCLVQDDPGDLDRGIRNMDIVYESAYFTLIAASGPGADSGLHGVRRASRGSRQDLISVKPGLDMLRVKSLDEHLGNSVWASRGWTLQEHHLSRRTINFVNGQVYFRCRRKIWSEETWTDLKHSGGTSHEWTANLINIAQEGMDELGDDIDFDSYSFFFEAIRRFQKRNLTMEDDAIKAMSGIMQRVAECSGTEFLEALPVKIFPVALLFSHAAAEKFSFERGLPPRRRRTFPSWSWAGWANYPNWGVFDSGRFEESLRRCRITLYKFRPQEKPELVWQPGTEGSGDSSDLPSWPHDIRTNRPYPLLCFSAFAAVFAVSRVEHGFGLFDKQGKLSGYLYPDYQPRFLDDQLIEVITFGVYENAYTPLVSVEEGCRDEVWAMYIEWDGDVYERRGIGRLLPSSLEKSLEGLVWKNVILG